MLLPWVSADLDEGPPETTAAETVAGNEPSVEETLVDNILAEERKLSSRQESPAPPPAPDYKGPSKKLLRHMCLRKRSVCLFLPK